MKFPISPLLAVGATVFALSIAGCGGGGGGSSSGPSNPSPTSTPVPTGVTVTVQLRDAAGAPVEGIVTIGAQRRSTTGGDAVFTRVSSGAQTASAQVNGTNYSKNFVATSGVNTVQIAINPAVGATPGGTPPAPPEF